MEDLFNYNGDRHAVQAQTPAPVEQPQQPSPIQQEANPNCKKGSICDWKPDAKAPGAKAWFEASDASAPQPLTMNQDGTYTVKFGDSLSMIAARELHMSGKSATKTEIDQEVQRLIDVNKAAYPTLDCNKHYVQIGWTLQLNVEATQPQPVAPPREAPPPPPPPAPIQRELPLPAPPPVPRDLPPPPPAPMPMELAPPPPLIVPAPLMLMPREHHGYHRGGYREPIMVAPPIALGCGPGQACDRSYRRVYPPYPNATQGEIFQPGVPPLRPNVGAGQLQQNFATPVYGADGALNPQGTIVVGPDGRRYSQNPAIAVPGNNREEWYRQEQIRQTQLREAEWRNQQKLLLEQQGQTVLQPGQRVAPLTQGAVWPPQQQLQQRERVAPPAAPVGMNSLQETLQQKMLRQKQEREQAGPQPVLTQQQLKEQLRSQMEQQKEIRERVAPEAQGLTPGQQQFLQQQRQHRRDQIDSTTGQAAAPTELRPVRPAQLETAAPPAAERTQQVARPAAQPPQPVEKAQAAPPPPQVQAVDRVAQGARPHFKPQSPLPDTTEQAKK